jgi:hypothetical protein
MRLKSIVKTIVVVATAVNVMLIDVGLKLWIYNTLKLWVDS